LDINYLWKILDVFVFVYCYRNMFGRPKARLLAPGSNKLISSSARGGGIPIFGNVMKAFSNALKKQQSAAWRTQTSRVPGQAMNCNIIQIVQDKDTKCYPYCSYEKQVSQNAIA
jgi:hypothetical protein